MLAKTDVTRIYETVLSIPGMNDHVKISLSLSRKNVLLLSKIIERGLLLKDHDVNRPMYLILCQKKSYRNQSNSQMTCLIRRA